MLTRRTGILLIVLGLLVATSALLGPLVLGVVRFHVSPSAEAQLVGGDVVSLVVVAPLAIVAGALWLLGNPLAPALALAPSVYALYMYVQYIVGPDYTRYPGNNEYAFPLYLALILLSWATGLSAWRALAITPLPRLGIGMRRGLAAMLLVLNITFGFAWIASVAAVLTSPHTSAAWQEYALDPTLFWLIRMMDLGFVIPASFVVAVGLIRRAPWSVTMAYAFLGFQTLIVAAVACMAVVMNVRSDPASNPVLLAVTLLLTVALAWMFVSLLRAQRSLFGRPASIL